MIKGVNKKIIEINNPNSEYFDKVVLYIKPNIEVRSNGELSYEVNKCLKSITNSKSIEKKSSITTVYIITLAIILIATIVFILIWVVHYRYDIYNNYY